MPILKHSSRLNLKEGRHDLEVLSPAARNGLEGSLLTRLSETALPTLSSRYDIYCNVRQPLSFAPSVSPDGDMYRRFMQKMCAGEWAGLLCEYVVLARLLATIVDFWVESATQFLQRVNNDLKALQEQFCPEERLHHIVDIQSGLSDPHHHGQTVIRVAFDNGLKLVYKPRNLDLDAAWFNVLRRVNQSGPLHAVSLCARAFPERVWLDGMDVHAPLPDTGAGPAILRARRRAALPAVSVWRQRFPA